MYGRLTDGVSGGASWKQPIVWVVRHRYTRNCANFANHSPHRRAPRSRSALAMTDTELKLMAAAAMIGDSNTPNNG